MSQYQTDPALVEAVGQRLGEQRADTLALRNTIQKILLALIEPNAKERARIAQEALAALDAVTRRAAPLTTTQVLQRAEEAGYHVKRQ